MVANNQIDFFFDLNDKAPVTGLTGRILRREEIVFVASKKHAGDIAPAGRPNKKIPLSQIAEEDFVLTERNEGYRIELDRLLAACGISVSPVAEFGNPETIIRLIERDMGLSFLPLFCAAEKIKQGDLTVIETDAPKIYMYSQLFYHKNKWIDVYKRQLEVSASSWDDALLSEMAEIYQTTSGLSNITFEQVSQYAPFEIDESSQPFEVAFRESYDQYHSTDLESVNMAEVTPCGIIYEKNSNIEIMAAGVTERTTDNFAGAVITYMRTLETAE